MREACCVLFEITNIMYDVCSENTLWGALRNITFNVATLKAFCVIELRTVAY